MSLLHTPRYETGASALLVSVQRPEDDSRTSAETGAELHELVLALGFRPLGPINAKLRKPYARYLFGTGKAHEIAAEAEKRDAEWVVFDDQLSPSQQRNWEQLTQRTVVDRQEIILDIFARHARTTEAKLQVELAQMQYYLPRLAHAWTHLSRQKGGRRGTRGEGEKQIELDRRQVLRRIRELRDELREVQASRATMRKRRVGVPVPTGSIVGYTNAGKSSLMRILTDSRVRVANQPFATLDATTRRLAPQFEGGAVLTDTVGFIQKLPPSLIDAFKSTLEETVLAQFLVHVVDASSRNLDGHFAATTEVLEELGVADRPRVVVFNKIDLLADRIEIHAAAERLGCDPERTALVSAKTGEGINRVLELIRDVIDEQSAETVYAVPADRYDLIAYLHRNGHVLSEEHYNGVIEVRAHVAPEAGGKLAAYKCMTSHGGRSNR